MSKSIRHLLGEFLAFSQSHELSSYPTRAVLEESLTEFGITLCMVDASTNRDWAQALLSDLAMLNSKLPVVAVHAESDPDYILRTLRAGATEVLIAPYASDQFIPVMERLNAVHGSAQRQGKIIASIPAKGACGASTTAYNIAHYLKQTGASRVLLADLDPLTGTIPFLLKLKSSYNFTDAVSRAHGLDEDIWRGMLANWGKIEVLLSPDKPVHGIDDQGDAVPVLQFAGGLYDYSIIDTNMPYGRWALSIAHACDELLLVTTNELACLQAAQKALAYYNRQRVDRSKIRIVVNRFSKDFGLSQEVIEAALHSEVYHIIPDDYESINRALVEGKPAPSATPAGKAMQKLAERISGKTVRQTQTKQSGLSSLLGGLLRR